MGQELNLEYTLTLPTHGSRTFSSPVIAGSYQALTTIGGSVSGTILTDLQTTITETKTKLESNDPAQLATINREAILGDMFYAGSLGYFAQYIALIHVAGLQQGAHQALLPSIGTYGYVPKVNYLFGLPRAIEPGGIEMDLDNISTFTGTNQNDRTQLVNFVQQTGILSSSLEHSISELMFKSRTNTAPQAVSTIKAFTIANNEGQNVYLITPENKLEIFSRINIEPETEDEIKLALVTGKHVITHDNMVSVPGWNGHGYTILDPETLDGAYKISSGINGSVLKDIDEALGTGTFVQSIFGISTKALEFTDDSVALDTIGKGMTLISSIFSVFNIAAQCPEDAARVLILFSTFLTLISLSPGLLVGILFAPIVAMIIGLILSIAFAIAIDYLVTGVCKKP